MPPVSEKQRRAMYAAAEGHSNLGIPQSVGREFIAKDSETVRSYDPDGRLHVSASNISKANICPYAGREIPGWRALGLDPDQVYSLLRDPEELAKAAETFNNLPVLSEHVPVTALGEDSHRPDIVVGSTGTDAAFDGEYLTNSLVIWAKPSIEGIETDEKRELSSAYRYRADMTPGNYEGVAYDGVMRDIVGNHVALVFEGRAGPDVIVGDEQPMALKSKKALLAAVSPVIAQDAKISEEVLTRALEAVWAGAQDNYDTDVPQQGIPPITAADGPGEGEAVAKLMNFLKDKMSDQDYDEACRMIQAEEAMDEKADKEPKGAEDEGGDEPPAAMDEKQMNDMIKQARQDALAEAAAIRTAEREVAPVVGEVVAMDSASAVYKLGLEGLGIDISDIKPKNYGSTFRACMAVRSTNPAVAMDARPSATARSDFNSRFPKRLPLVKG